ncbi:hypothetical protein ACWEV3_16570 [Saccharopolyspora sp. NPDC003752]
MIDGRGTSTSDRQVPKLARYALAFLRSFADRSGGDRAEPFQGVHQLGEPAESFERLLAAFEVDRLEHREAEEALRHGVRQRARVGHLGQRRPRQHSLQRCAHLDDPLVQRRAGGLRESATSLRPGDGLGQQERSLKKDGCHCSGSARGFLESTKGVARQAGCVGPVVPTSRLSAVGHADRKRRRHDDGLIPRDDCLPHVLGKDRCWL